MSYVVTKHLATLFKGGAPEYTKEVNIMTWNQSDPKLDIRRWENGYPRKGISLNNDEAKKLFEALQFYFFNKGEKPEHNPDLNGYAVENVGGVSYRINDNLAVLFKSNNGYTKEVNVITWNHGARKIDIRNWSPERKCAKGISLSMNEAMKLLAVLEEQYVGFEDYTDEIPDFDGE